MAEPMNDATANELLKENLWILDPGDQVTDFDLLGTGTITRRIKDVRNEDLKALIVWIQTYTSSINYEAGPNAIDTVLEPQVDHRPMPGTWRRGAVRYEHTSDDSSDIVMELHKVSAQVFTHASERSCMNDGDSLFYTDRTVGLDAPTAAQRGMYTVSNSLNDEGLYDSNLLYRASLETSFLEARSRAGLTDGDAGVYRNQDSPLAAPAGGIGGIYQAGNRINDDCTYDGELLYEHGNAAFFEFESRQTPFLTQTSGVYRNRDGKITAPAPGSGGVYQATNDLNRFYLYDSTLLYTSTNLSGKVLFSSGRAGLEDSDTGIYKEWNVQTDAPVSEQGGLYQSSNRLTDGGFYDSTLTYQLAREALVEFASRNSSFQTETSALYHNSKVQIDAPPSASGGMYSATNRLNQFYMYDSTLVYHASNLTGKALFSTGRAGLEDSDTGIYKEWNVQTDAPVSGQGGLYQSSNRLTDGGFYDSTLTYQSAREALVKFSSRRTSFRDETSALYHNSKVQIDAPAADAGGMYRATNQLNDFYMYDSTLIYQAGNLTGKVLFKASQNSGRIVSSALYRDWNEQIDAPVAGVAGMYEASNSLNDNGLYDSTLLYRSSEEQAASASWSTRLGTASLDVYSNRRAQPDYSGLTADNNNTVDMSINADDTFDVRVRSMPTNNGGSIEVWSDTMDPTYVYKPRYTFLSGKAMKREFYFMTHVRQTTSKSVAYAHATTHDGLKADVSSGVQVFSNHKYRATFVYMIDEGAWVEE